MPRLLTDQNWFESISSRSWHEGDFENLIVSRAAEIFPRWTCVPFSTVVEGDNGVRKKPDLALIDEQYREWWVVEVELAHHSLRGHVIPQVEVFQSGNYQREHAEALHSHLPTLDLDRLNRMMLGISPNVIVIGDSPSLISEWKGPLSALSVRLAIVEPFRNNDSRIIFRINGDSPEPPGEILSRCSRHTILSRLWRVHSPAALPVSVDHIEIECLGSMSRWAVIGLQDAIYLRADGGEALEDLALVELVRRGDGSLLFEAVKKIQTGRRQS